MIQRAVQEAKDSSSKIQNYYFQIILLKLLSQSSPVNQMSQLKFTINKGRQKFQETQYISGSPQGQNAMAFTSHPKLNFVVLNYSTSKSQQFSLKITYRKDKVEKQLGQFVINCNVYVDSFLQNSYGAFEESIALENHLQLNIEVFIQKKRYLIEKLVRQIHGHGQPQKKNQPKLYSKLQKIIQKSTFVKKDPLKSQPERSNSFKRNISIRQLKEQLQTSRSRSKNRKSIMASPHKLKLKGLEKDNTKPNAMLSPLQQKIQKTIPSETNIKVSQASPTVIEAPTASSQTGQKMAAVAINVENDVIIDPMTVKASIQTQHKPIQYAQEKIIQQITPAEANITIQQDNTNIQNKQITMVISEENTEVKPTNVQIITNQEPLIKTQVQTARVLAQKQSLQHESAEKIIPDPSAQIPQQNEAPGKPQQLINEANIQPFAVKQQTQNQRIQNIEGNKQSLANNQAGAQLIKNDPSLISAQILILQDLEKNITPPQKLLDQRVIQPAQNNEEKAKESQIKEIQFAKTQSNYVNNETFLPQAKALNISQINRQQSVQTPHFNNSSNGMLQFINESHDQVTQNVEDINTPQNEDINTPQNDPKRIASDTSIIKAEQAAGNNVNVSSEQNQLSLKNKIMLITIAFLVIMAAYLFIGFFSSPSQNLNIKKGKQATKVKPKAAQIPAKTTKEASKPKVTKK